MGIKSRGIFRCYLMLVPMNSSIFVVVGISEFIAVNESYVGITCYQKRWSENYLQLGIYWLFAWDDKKIFYQISPIFM